MDTDDAPALLTVGEIRGVYGVKGWVKLFSWTSPRENLLDYRRFVTQTGKAMTLLAARPQGKSLVGLFEGVTDRDAAQALNGTRLSIRRTELPATGDDEFYWADLIGAEVNDIHAGMLGVVDHLIETGANDVLVVMRDDGSQLLVPFVMRQVVKNVDLADRRIDVDWPGADALT